MTSQKASFQQDKQTQTVSQQSQRSVLSSPHEQMTSYVYGLLSPEEGHFLERRVEENAALQEALEASLQEKTFFNHWADVPVPKGLSEKTMLRIQELENLSDSSSSSV